VEKCEIWMARSESTSISWWCEEADWKRERLGRGETIGTTPKWRPATERVEESLLVRERRGRERANWGRGRGKGRVGEGKGKARRRMEFRVFYLFIFLNKCKTMSFLMFLSFFFNFLKRRRFKILTNEKFFNNYYVSRSAISGTNLRNY